MDSDQGDQPEPEHRELGEDADAPSRPAPAARRSTGGQMLGAAMMGLHEVFVGPKRDEIVIQVEAAGDPPNIDTDGLDEFLSDGSRITGPPLDQVKRTRRERRGRRRS